MLTILSPAKNLDFSEPVDPPAFTEPALSGETRVLSEVTRTLSAGDLKRLMGVSDDLARLNHERFQAFSGPGASHMAASFAFAGDVYRGLDARSFSHKDLSFAQDRLRILSGLYGLLRPLDRIEPYRLEMGTKLANPRGATLYAFWGARIAEQLNADFPKGEPRTLVNLASKEYFGAVDRDALDAEIITPAFKDIKDGKARILFVYAKRARGLMARWIIENRITSPAQLKDFDVEGYRFDADASSAREWVFTRPQPAKKAA